MMILPRQARDKHRESTQKSPFSQVIKTPFFMFNSKYDAWQLGSEFQSVGVVCLPPSLPPPSSVSVPDPLQSSDLL